MNVYERVIRPLAFSIPPDRAHEIAQFALRWPAFWRLLSAGWSAGRDMSGFATTLAGIELESPIGVAPGLDKNGRIVRSLDALGFGYVVVGSITPSPRGGNPRPRMNRQPSEQSLTNNLGLPSEGLEAVVSRLSRIAPNRGPLIASVTAFTAEELVNAALRIEPFVDAVELGLACPNTTDSERMLELRTFRDVADGVSAKRTKPVFVRIPPHHDSRDWSRTRSLLDVTLEAGFEGVGTNGRRRVDDPYLSEGHGSISGRPTFVDAARIVSDIAAYSSGRLAIRASGGVFSGFDAIRMLRAGATTVEIYSALVFRGPAVASKIQRELLQISSDGRSPA